jgi:hypothetical protein
MRPCFVNPVKASPTTTVLCGLLSLVVALLAACGDRETSPTNSVDLSVVGQTVTKVRPAGDQIVVLEERLTSLSENGPQRTLAIVGSDGRTLRTYMPPSEWSVVDFAVHPSGDTSVVLTTAAEVRIVRLIQMVRFEVTDHFSTPRLQQIPSSTMPEASKTTTLFSRH